MAISSTYMSSTKCFFTSGYGLSEEAASVKWMDRKQGSTFACEEHLFFTGHHHLSQETTAKAILQYLDK